MSEAADPVDYDAMQTVGDIARYHARHCPQSPAFIYQDRTTSWAEFDANTDRVARALYASGCKPGDRVGYVGKGCDEFFELLFGGAKAGIITAPVQWRLAPTEMAQILADCAPSILFVTPEFAGILPIIIDALAHRPLVIAVDGAIGELPQFATWRDAASDGPLPHADTPDTVFLMLYTSGTTGLPKGVMLTHRNMLDGRRLMRQAGFDWNVWSPDDVNLMAMPIAHIGGTGAAVAASFHGAVNIVHAQFEPALMLAAFERYGVSKLFIVPAAIRQLLAHPDVRSVDYSRLRTMIYGASPIALDLLREAVDVFDCGFCQHYGMTETCGSIAYLPPPDHEVSGNPRMRSAGLPMPGVELRVVDPDSRAILPPGETGEIEIRSIQNMAGYWGKPEETARTQAPDGWLKTGDAGFLDADGYLFLHDRIKDMIVSGAENIYPAEVESAIFGHPAVADVAVIGVPDPRWGEAVKACVVLAPDKSASEAEIIDFARARIAGYKLPKSVDFIAEVPRNAAGKVLKRELRAPYWAGRERAVN